MIRYFNGCIELSEVEKAELKSVYDSGGRLVKICKDEYGYTVVEVYTEKHNCEKNYVVAHIYGTTAQALHEIIGCLAEGNMVPLANVIEKYANQ